MSKAAFGAYLIGFLVGYALANTHLDAWPVAIAVSVLGSFGAAVWDSASRPPGDL